MIYPKTSLVTLLLILLGVHPFHEKRKAKWHQKIHILGAFFTILQVPLTIYTCILEQKQGAFGSGNENNIIEGFVLMKKVFALLLPLYTILLKFFTVRSTETFHEKLDYFDVFLRVAQQKVGPEFECLEGLLEQKERKVNCFAGVLIILVELFNIVTGVAYMIDIRGQIPSFNVIYFYHSALTIFMTCSLNIYCKLHGVWLRHELFNQYVKDVWQTQWQRERNARKNKRELLKWFIVERNVKGEWQTSSDGFEGEND